VQRSGREHRGFSRARRIAAYIALTEDRQLGTIIDVVRYHGVYDQMLDGRRGAAVRPSYYDRPVHSVIPERGVLTMTTVLVGLRLCNEAWTRHAAAAQVLGLPLSTYIRQRLDEQDRTAAAVAELRGALERRAATEASKGEPALSPGVVVEVLLLLRVLAGPERATYVQKEVERRGLEVWR
jgi:hypothetical protein